MTIENEKRVAILRLLFAQLQAPQRLGIERHDHDAERHQQRIDGGGSTMFSGASARGNEAGMEG